MKSNKAISCLHVLVRGIFELCAILMWWKFQSFLLNKASKVVKCSAACRFWNRSAWLISCATWWKLRHWHVEVHFNILFFRKAKHTRNNQATACCRLNIVCDRHVACVDCHLATTCFAPWNFSFATFAANSRLLSHVKSRKRLNPLSVSRAPGFKPGGLKSLNWSD